MNLSRYQELKDESELLREEPDSRERDTRLREIITEMDEVLRD